VPDASPAQNSQTKRARNKPGPKGIPLGAIVEYYRRGLNQTEIAALLGVNKSAISQRLKPVRASLDNLETFKNCRADIFALYGRELLYSLTPDDLKRMPPGSRVLAACQLYDKERLERGQASEIIQYSQFDNKIEALDAEIEELESKLADAGRLLPVPDDYAEKAGESKDGGPDS
jgi:transcriptional regulator with XRE-family HTH domain